MDDIMSRLSEVLNDPKSMEQISKLASSLSDNSDPNNQQAEKNDISAMLSSLLSSADSEQKQSDNTPAVPDIAKLIQLGNIISSSAANDNNIALLTSLKPLLKEENKIKADRLIQIFRLLNAYPLIRDSGLLGGDLFG